MASRKYWAALATLGIAAFAAAIINQSAGGAPGGPAQSLRIVVVNPARILKEMQETKDLESRLNAEGQSLAGEERGMKDKIKKLEDQRGNFRPNSPQYDEVQKQYIKAVAEWKVWGETFMAERDWRMKALTKMLFDKVTVAITDYASREGIDVVISDFQPQVTEKALAAMNVEQLREFLNQRRVLYSSKQADVSDQIIALLDTKYRQEGGGAGAVGAAGGGGAGPAAAIPSIGATGGGAGGASQPAPGTGAARPAGPDGGPGAPRRPNNR
jgi:Skp family chaperone for outer membrane proteins